MHLELPIAAFVAAVLVLVPLPWHWRARNIPVLSMTAWLFISNTIYGINAIVWANNVDIVIPVWCDISKPFAMFCFSSRLISLPATKLQIGATMALPACCLCICIRLERISSVRQVSMAYGDKKRRMISEALICWGVPMVYMALRTFALATRVLYVLLTIFIDFVVQGHRFDIIENLGCRPATFSSLESILIVWVPPLIVVVLTWVYAS